MIKHYGCLPFSWLISRENVLDVTCLNMFCIVLQGVDHGFKVTTNEQTFIVLELDEI